MRGLLLLDRDGTLIEERHYLSDPADVVLLPHAVEGLKLFRQAGFRLALITNQSGIGRGLFTLDQMHAVNERLCRLLAAHGVRLDGIFYCPHMSEDNCACRKPATGLAEQALAQWPAPEKLVVIGDKASDIEMGIGLGATSILVLTGYGAQEQPEARPDIVAKDLLDAAMKIQAHNL